MPKVYDKEGRELTVGARVKLASGVLIGEIAEFDFTRKKARVRWARDLINNLIISFQPSAPPTAIDFGQADKRFTCPDLLLIDSPTERKANA